MKLPPSSADAEQAVLGSCLLDATAITRIREMLEPDDFFRDSHKLIYRAICVLVDKGWPADIVSLADELDRREELGKAGGVPYIHSLPLVVPTAIHCEYYAEIVRRTAIKRRLIEVASHVAAIGYDDEIEVDDAITQAEDLFLKMQLGARTRQSGVFTVDDVEDEVQVLYDSGWEGGLKTPWPELDPHYSVCRKELTLITGVPAHGKSNFLDALMVGLAKEEKMGGYNWRFLVSSPEMPIPKHVASLAEKYMGIPFGQGPTPRMTPRDLAEGKEWVKEHFTWVLPYEGHRNIKSILNLMATAMGVRAYDGFVLDPWNQFEHDHPKEITETKYISAELTRLKNFAVKHALHCWLVAHPTKMQRDPKTKQYPVPKAYDIADSAHFFNKSDNIITVWRDVGENNDLVDIHVQKVKFRQNGVPGKATLHWDRATGDFESMRKT